MQTNSLSRFKLSYLLIILAFALAGLALTTNFFGLDQGLLAGRFQTFVTIFLGIFIEAVPFLLAGSIVSGLIAVFVKRETVYRFVPRRALPAALAGAAMGFAFPVCECGVVPVTRRLYQKGLPPSVGIAFLLAAPVINPIVIASTYAAFGWGPMLWGRIGLSFLFATTVGFLFHLAKPQEILRPDLLQQQAESQLLVEDSRQRAAHTTVASGALSAVGTLPGTAPSVEDPGSEADREDLSPACTHEHPPAKRPDRIWQALGLAGEDFMDMARYLIAGSMLAAAMQTLIPQSTLLALGSGPVISVLVLLLLAFVLSVCSTVDAFLALAFVNTFPPAAVLSFLVFGPMVDIKSSLLFLGVFRRRVVAYLILLPLLLTMAVAIYINLNIGW